MKVLKPQRLGLIHRVVEHHRRCKLVVSVLVYVPLGAPRKLLAEQALWKDVAEHLPGGVADEGVPKPVGEALVSGSAYAPGGKAARGVRVRLEVRRDDRALVDKQLVVVGDRYWKGGKPSEPLAFESVPVDWAHAFGGEGYASNPVGKGCAPVQTEHGPIHWLPNVEDPSKPVASKTDKPAPAGLGPYDPMWPQRFEHVGKRYGREWLETLFPAPAEDFDAHYYCVAPVDQRVEGFFRGDELVAVEGMHPAKARTEGTLEPLTVRAFIVREGKDDMDLEPMTTRLDTVHVIPALERAVLVHRGVVPVREDDADDVRFLMIAAEDPAQPRGVEHYRRVLALRLDPDKGALASLKDEDLMPPVGQGWSAKLDPGDLGTMVHTELHALEAASRGRERALQEGRAELEAAGFDASAYDDRPELELGPPPDPYDVDAVMEYADKAQAFADKHRAEAEQQKQEAEQAARAAMAEAGFDYDELTAQAMAEAGGPPDFSADAHLGMLHDMVRIAAEGGAPLEELESELTDPRFEQGLIELEQQVRDGYRRSAQFLPPAVTSAEQAAMLRVKVQAARQSGEPLDGMNLTGADLHGLDLSGASMAGALLEGASLRGAMLGGANLSEAVLARADLTDASLGGAKLSGANLGEARLCRTDLSGADLADAVLVRALLDGAVLAGATMHGADLFEAKMVQADLGHVDAHELVLLRLDLRQTSLIGARLTRAMVIECDLTGCDLTGCDLSGAQLIGCQADDVCLVGGTLERLMVVHGSSMQRAHLDQVRAAAANFYSTVMSGAYLEGAQLDGANLCKCDLRGAKLRRMRARDALLIRANLEGADARETDLLGAIMQKVRLGGTDLRGANLARADISRARLDGNTRVDGALMLDTRVDPKYQEPSA